VGAAVPNKARRISSSVKSRVINVSTGKHSCFPNYISVGSALPSVINVSATFS